MTHTFPTPPELDTAPSALEAYPRYAEEIAGLWVDIDFRLDWELLWDYLTGAHDALLCLDEVGTQALRGDLMCLREIVVCDAVF